MNENSADDRKTDEEIDCEPFAISINETLESLINAVIRKKISTTDVVLWVYLLVKGEGIKMMQIESDIGLIEKEFQNHLSKLCEIGGMEAAFDPDSDSDEGFYLVQGIPNKEKKIHPIKDDYFGNDDSRLIDDSWLDETD